MCYPEDQRGRGTQGILTETRPSSCPAPPGRVVPAASSAPGSSRCSFGGGLGGHPGRGKKETRERRVRFVLSGSPILDPLNPQGWWWIEPRLQAPPSLQPSHPLLRVGGAPGQGPGVSNRKQVVLEFVPGTGLWGPVVTLHSRPVSEPSGTHFPFLPALGWGQPQATRGPSTCPGGPGHLVLRGPLTPSRFLSRPPAPLPE